MSLNASAVDVLGGCKLAEIARPPPDLSTAALKRVMDQMEAMAPRLPVESESA